MVDSRAWARYIRSSRPRPRLMWYVDVCKSPLPSVSIHGNMVESKTFWNRTVFYRLYATSRFSSSKHRPRDICLMWPPATMSPSNPDRHPLRCRRPHQPQAYTRAHQYRPSTAAPVISRAGTWRRGPQAILPPPGSAQLPSVATANTWPWVDVTRVPSIRPRLKCSRERTRCCVIEFVILVCVHCVCAALLKVTRDDHF